VQAIGEHLAHTVAPSPEVARDRDDRHGLNLVESAAAGSGGFRKRDKARDCRQRRHFSS